jgi:hypothetical protein
VTDDEAREFLRTQGYLAPVVLNGKWAAIWPLMFTDAIVSGPMETITIGPENRWCYQKDGHSATEALLDWLVAGLMGEPEKWHRNPFDGRRRPDGDPNREYVDP